MYKTFICTILSLFLLAACGDGEAPADLAPGEAQATAASEADGGEAPVIVFQRAIEGPSSLEEWRIYAGGRTAIISPSADGDVTLDETQIDEGAVNALLQDLEAAGFYEAAETGEQRWREGLMYIISTHQDGAWQSLALERVTPETSPVRLQSLGVMEKFIFDEIGS